MCGGTPGIRRIGRLALCIGSAWIWSGAASAEDDAKLPRDFESQLVAHWKLAGDCMDHSGHDNHGRSHRAVVTKNGARFDGRGSYVEVPSSESLSLGTESFSILAWVKCDETGTDVIGDVVSKYASTNNSGITLSINASAGGYNAQGSNRLLCFGIDNDKLGEWQDCGRPSEAAGFVNNYVNSLTVFKGELYVATTHAHKQEDYCHVLRYQGGDKWVDCGRVGTLHAEGVGPMLVHNGELYVATWNYDHSRRRDQVLATWDYGHVFRYQGGKRWEDCGQPGKNRHLMCLASYRGELFVAGDGAARDAARQCYVYAGDKDWKVCGEFDQLPHCFALHDGKLWLGTSGGGTVHAYDGQKWQAYGNPAQILHRTDPDGPIQPGFITQVHAMEVTHGQLCVGSWPRGLVAALDGGREWRDRGYAADSLVPVEINSMVVYNGNLYAGTLPRIGLWRYAGDGNWSLLKRFLSSEDPYRARLTSLTVYNGTLFASAGCSNGNVFDEPSDVRGKVFSIQAGTCISYDYDLGTGWKHLAAVKDAGSLRLYVDGQLVSSSAPFQPGEYDLSNEEPLRIGFGATDYFSGMIRDVRLYKSARTRPEIKRVIAATRL